MLPDAHAASWRAVGKPWKAGSTVASMAPRGAWPQNSSPARLPTWATSISDGSTPASARAAGTASASRP